MASTFVSAGEQCKEHGKNPSFGKLKRSWSSNESSCSAGQGTKTCVCAPATHAGSFKCRLHRVYNDDVSTQEHCNVCKCCSTI